MLAIWSLVLFFPLCLLMVSRMCSCVCVCVLFFPLYLLMVSKMCVCLNQIGAANEIMPIRSYKWEVEEHQD